MSRNVSLFKNKKLNSWIVYKPNWSKITDEEFNELKSLITEHHKVKMLGKLVNLPRKQLYFGQSYGYSGTTSIAQITMPPIITKILEKGAINELIRINLTFRAFTS